MPKLKRTPQDKKRLSYAKDRRNDYGESAKSSRRSIARFKARDIRRERHGKNQALQSVLGAGTEDQQVAAEVAARTVKRRLREKVPDIPLGEYIASQRRKRVNRSHRRAKLSQRS